MTDQRTQEQLDHRWDIHSERQIAASKGGVTAVTILNSGSWIALLSQADKLINLPGGEKVASAILLYWGLGAFFGTVTWLFVYLSTMVQALHDFHRDVKLYRTLLEVVRWFGLACVAIALSLFLCGVFALARILPVN